MTYNIEFRCVKKNLEVDGGIKNQLLDDAGKDEDRGEKSFVQGTQFESEIKDLFEV